MHDRLAATVKRTAAGNTISARYEELQRRFPTVAHLRNYARRHVPHFAFEYMDGGAGADGCIARNWNALDAVELVPRYGVTSGLPPVEVARVPLSPAARRAVAADATLLETALTGGDDYEILCTMPSATFAAFSEAAGRTGVAVTAIGRIAAGEDARFLDHAGNPLTFKRGSYSHF